MKAFLTNPTIRLPSALGATAANTVEDIVVNVYPNPTVDKVYLSVNANIQLYTPQGVFLYSGFGSEVDLTDYPKSVYLLQINRETTVKVVKL